MKTVHVMFCWNDRRGNFCGRMEKVDFQTPDGHNHELESKFVEGIRVRHAENKFKPNGISIKIGKDYFTCLTWTPWVGNIHWDGTTMTANEFTKLLLRLMAEGFRPMAGSVEFCDAWDMAEQSGESDPIREWVKKEWTEVPA